MHRYAILRSLADGKTTQMAETRSPKAAKRSSERLAKSQGGYFFVVDRVSQSVVYVYAQPQCAQASDGLVALTPA